MCLYGTVFRHGAVLRTGKANPHGRRVRLGSAYGAGERKHGWLKVARIGGSRVLCVGDGAGTTILNTESDLATARECSVSTPFWQFEWFSCVGNKWICPVLEQMNCPVPRSGFRPFPPPRCGRSAPFSGWQRGPPRRPRPGASGAGPWVLMPWIRRLEAMSAEE